jgi:5-methylcytosine-specific restriction endonuclease McrA
MSDTHTPAALRRLVYERAGGHCEYCLIPDTLVLVAHQIDHIIAEKHGGLTEADNLALACVLCNKHKGSDLASIDPQTGEIVPLYHPRRDR